MALTSRKQCQTTQFNVLRRPTPSWSHTVTCRPRKHKLAESRKKLISATPYPPTYLCAGQFSVDHISSNIFFRGLRTADS